jgi:hypothetical protein
MVALFWKFLRGIPFPSRTRRRSGSGLFFRKSALTTQRSHLCFRNVYWSEGLQEGHTRAQGNDRQNSVQHRPLSPFLGFLLYS